MSVVLGRRRLKDESTSQDQNGGGLMGVLEIGDVELGGLVGDEGLGGVIIIGNKSLIGGLGNKVSTPPRRLLHNAMVMKKQGRRRLLS